MDLMDYHLRWSQGFIKYQLKNQQITILIFLYKKIGHIIFDERS